MKKTKPTCKLSGENGNVFNLIGITSEVLIQNGMINESKEMSDRCHNSESYDEVMCVISEYVDNE